MELADAVRLAVDAAIAEGAGDAEAFAQRQAGREIRVHGGEVESLTAATERGVGLRTWIEGSAGYAHGTELSEPGLRELARRAVAATRIVDEDPNAVAPQPGAVYPRLDGLRDSGLGRWGSDRAVALALAIERAATSRQPRVRSVEQAVYADSDDEVAIRSSTGIDCGYEASSCYAFVQALGDGDGSKETGLGFDLARSPEQLDAEAIGSEGAERAASMIGAGKPPSRTCPVVFDPTVAASFAGLIGSALQADAVQRGRSPFVEMLGEQVASEALVLNDDGLDAEGLAASPCDDEGIPRQRLALIEGGRLRALLHDSYTARRAAVERAGNARRAGHRSAPAAAPSNLVVEAGSLATAALLSEAGDGVFVSDVAGLHSGVNSVTGVFSVGASGHLLSGGELAEPVREFTIASDLISMLRSVREVGSEGRWVPFGGSVRTPPLLIGEMTVSGS